MDAAIEAEVVERRMRANNPNENKLHQELLDELGVTQEELNGIEVDIETE